MDRLSGVIQPYHWGDAGALAQILGHEPSGGPEAEYWLGSHHLGPGLLGEHRLPLDEEIRRRPAALLGSVVAEQFGDLPFLVKILAAAGPLSIQAHPSAAQARLGFELEEAAGIDRTANHRRYRDPRHKPELICAMTRFEARCGFRDPAETVAVLDLLGPGLAEVADRLTHHSPADVAIALLRLPAGEGARLTAATDRGARIALDDPDLAPRLRAELSSTVAVGQLYPGDVGVVVALLLNHVVLRPGQALFLSAGNLHAYLRGVGVEVMANSDNVLRGGLTSKHVDVDELDAILDRRWGPVDVLQADGPAHTFRPPIAEFALTRFDGSSNSVGQPILHAAGPEVLLVTRGAMEVATPVTSLRLDQGQAALMTPSDGTYRLTMADGPAVEAWRVTVGGAGADAGQLA